MGGWALGSRRPLPRPARQPTRGGGGGRQDAAPLFGSSSIVPVGNANHALIGLTPEQASKLKLAYPAGGVPSIDADIQRCQAVLITQIQARRGCWADLDKKLMEQVVPWVPLVWDVATILTAPSLTRYEFDQSTGEISLTRIAANNKERMP